MRARANCPVTGGEQPSATNPSNCYTASEFFAGDQLSRVFQQREASSDATLGRSSDLCELPRGQVGMLDVRDAEHPVQTGIVNLGIDAGPHMIALTDDDKRLVVSDYFLNEDDFGKIHFEGDHHVHVVKVFKDHLALDSRFDVDFNTAFATGRRGRTVWR